jgi:hypothetical protein
LAEDEEWDALAQRVTAEAAKQLQMQQDIREDAVLRLPETSCPAPEAQGMHY